ncbi:MAG: hypothetical protein NTY48_07225 [Candidatus Diapherotrites archaeon]|nr:hypothetical protein [Candidatus Diapherotrites archaeon]
MPLRRKTKKRKPQIDSKTKKIVEAEFFKLQRLPRTTAQTFCILAQKIGTNPGTVERYLLELKRRRKLALSVCEALGSKKLNSPTPRIQSIKPGRKLNKFKRTLPAKPVFLKNVYNRQYWGKIDVSQAEYLLANTALPSEEIAKIACQGFAKFSSAKASVSRLNCKKKIRSGQISMLCSHGLGLRERNLENLAKNTLNYDSLPKLSYAQKSKIMHKYLAALHSILSEKGITKPGVRKRIIGKVWKRLDFYKENVFPKTVFVLLLLRGAMIDEYANKIINKIYGINYRQLRVKNLLDREKKREIIEAVYPVLRTFVKANFRSNGIIEPEDILHNVMAVADSALDTFDPAVHNSPLDLLKLVALNKIRQAKKLIAEEKLNLNLLTSLTRAEFLAKYPKPKFTEHIERPFGGGG